MLKLISWNVNGLRACCDKGFREEFARLDADFFCLQETKVQEGQIQLDLPEYHQFWNYAEKKGYSGTAIFSKSEPLSVKLGIGVDELDTEGRVITLEYADFYLVTCYTPNAQRELVRIDHRMRWEAAFADFLVALDFRPIDNLVVVWYWINLRIWVFCKLFFIHFQYLRRSPSPRRACPSGLPASQRRTCRPQSSAQAQAK